MGKVLLWRDKIGKLHGQATRNPAKLRKFLGLNTATSSVIDTGRKGLLKILLGKGIKRKRRR